MWGSKRKNETTIYRHYTLKVHTKVFRVYYIKQKQLTFYSFINSQRNENMSGKNPSIQKIPRDFLNDIQLNQETEKCSGTEDQNSLIITVQVICSDTLQPTHILNTRCCTNKSVIVVARGATTTELICCIENMVPVCTTVSFLRE